MSRSDFVNIHTIYAIEAWANVIDIHSQVSVKKGLIIKRLIFLSELRLDSYTNK